MTVNLDSVPCALTFGVIAGIIILGLIVWWLNRLFPEPR